MCIRDSSSIGKMGEGSKIGILIGTSMTFSFLAGLMNANIKNAVDRAVPLLNRINPAAVISDALYCVNGYDAPGRYAQDPVSYTHLDVYKRQPERCPGMLRWMKHPL